jgi:hypothetical protein
VHLFQPQQAWRFRWNKNTDTPLPPDEPAGDNPPDGAIIHYGLQQDAREPVAIEIADSQGGVVRRYSSADPVEPLVEGRNTPDYWIRPHRALSAKAGFHRFVWDLRHERPAVPSFSYPIAAIFRNTPREPRGSWVLPGSYTVRLTVAGRTLTQPLVVRLDPRMRTTPEDLRAQYDMSRAIDAALRRVAAALESPGANRQSLSRLQAELTLLFGIIEQTDATPTTQVVAAVKETLAAVDAAVR